jgi:transcriptional regulator with XRE-family HTH domain
MQMTDKRPRPCRSCQAMVRPGYGDVCDFCANSPDAPPLMLPGFFDTPQLRAALANYDFGPVFRAVRSATGMTQRALSERLKLEQHHVSDIENGKVQLRFVNLVTVVANKLGIPTGHLGYRRNTINPPQEEEVNPVYGRNRRGFFGLVNTLTVESVAVMTLDLERLDALAPDSDDRAVPRRIGADDVQTIRAMTALYRAADLRHGGGLARETAVALLGSTVRMRKSQCTELVRAELRLATAELGVVAGSMSFDVERHEHARRWWLIGLDAARESNHELATDIMVHIQLGLATQSIHLRNPKEALSFARLAEMTAASSDHPVSAQTRTLISLKQGTSQAMLGKAELFQRALDQSQEHASDIDPATAPPWTAHVTPTEVTGTTGGAMYRLAQHDPGHAPAAIEHLSTAINTYGDEYSRSRALNLSSLAGAYFQVGDLDIAIATGHRAVTEISALSSTRLHDRLWTLAKVAQPHNQHPEVAELRQRIHQTVTTVA